MCACLRFDVQYVGIVDSLRSGNLKQFRDSIETHRVKLLRDGVFLLVEQLEPYVLRRFFKRM